MRADTPGLLGRTGAMKTMKKITFLLEEIAFANALSNNVGISDLAATATEFLVETIKHKRRKRRAPEPKETKP